MFELLASASLGRQSRLYINAHRDLKNAHCYAHDETYNELRSSHNVNTSSYSI